MKTLLGQRGLGMFYQCRLLHYVDPDWHLLHGLPGCVDLSRGTAMHFELETADEAAIEAMFFRQAIRDFEVFRSHKQGPRPEFMLLRAYGWHWGQYVDVALLPYMDDAEAEAWVRGVTHGR